MSHEMIKTEGTCFMCLTENQVLEVLPLPSEDGLIGMELCEKCKDLTRKFVLKERGLQKVRLEVAAKKSVQPGKGKPTFDVEKLSSQQKEFYDQGLCPECRQIIRGYRRPAGPDADTVIRTYKANNVDPKTGHKTSCGLKSLAIHREEHGRRASR